MNYFKINGKTYDVTVTALDENFNILYSSNTGRTLADGAMTLDPIGTFYGHTVTVKRKSGHEKEFDDLFMYVSKPRYTGIKVEAAHNQKTISYDAYISNGKRALQRITRNDVVEWGELQLNIIPMKAQVLPE